MMEEGEMKRTRRRGKKEKEMMAKLMKMIKNNLHLRWIRPDSVL
jgi:hypothetical protein